MKNKKHTYSHWKSTAQRWTALLVCLFLIVSCGNLYTGDEVLFDPNVDQEPKPESVPVMVALSDPYYNILSTSRGVGKIDPEDSCFVDKMNPVDEEGNPLDKDMKPRFFVYSFRKSQAADYRVTRAEDPDVCLLDGSCGNQLEYGKYKDEYAGIEQHGKWAHYNGNGSFVNWHFSDDDLPYYSDDDPYMPFDFFAYYHDGAACGAVERTADQISFPVHIDGSQDLMCGVADLTDEQKKTIDEMPDEDQKQKLKDFYYSTYTGRSNIWPILQMNHQLAYVKINLKAGNAFGDAVLVHDIRLEARTQGTMVVAAKNKNLLGATFPADGPTEVLSLRNVINGDSIPETSEDPEADSWQKRNIRLEYNEDGTQPEPITVGEMLIPTGNDVVLHTWLSNQDTRWVKEHTALPLGDKVITDMVDHTVNGFVAGKTYNLNITVYGPKIITIEVKASPWLNGGDADIDIEENTSGK